MEDLLSRNRYAREPTDHQIVNVVAIQQSQEFFEVWRKLDHHNSSPEGPSCAEADVPQFVHTTTVSFPARQNRLRRKKQSDPGEVLV